MPEGVARGNNTTQKYIFGRKNLNYQEPSKAQDSEVGTSSVTDDFTESQRKYNEEIDKDFQDKVRDAVVGQTIESVQSDELILGNGTKLTLYESYHDRYAGAGGEWDVLQDTDSGITDIEFGEWDEEEVSDTYVSSMNINILHGDTKLIEGQCEANAGDGGYYMSVLSLKVEVPGQETLDEVILR